MIRRLAFAVALVAMTITASRAASSAPPNSDDLALIFRPAETSTMTMSPDGRYLAYTNRQGDDLYLVFYDLQQHTAKSLFVAHAEQNWSGVRGKIPAELTFMRWAAEDRLVFNLNRENVWSMTVDGNAQHLTDFRAFAPPLPPARIAIVSSGEDGGAGFSVTPPDPLSAAAAMEQPIHIRTMTRGDRYVYAEASMKSRGVGFEITGGRNSQYRETRLTGETPHVVLRIDAVTGKSEEWADAPESDTVLCDQSGYPRVILQSVNFHNAAETQQDFLYAAPKSDRWTPLDVVTKEAALGFHVEATNIAAERSIPLGFDFDGKTMYFASNVGRDTYGIYAFDSSTWQRTKLAIESNEVDLIDPLRTEPDPEALVFDLWEKKLVGLRYDSTRPATRWVDPRLARVQHTLDQVDPSKNWQILEWNQARNTFLVLATGLTEPGMYYIFHADDRTLDEVMNRAPWLTDAEKNPAAEFTIKAKDGTSLTGFVTTPQHVRIKRPPIVVLCHDGPWERDDREYNHEAQALAGMGFIVLQVNYRGSAGFGRKFMEAAREHPDTVPLEDITSAIDVITANQGDRRLIAIMGHGYGGYLALRAMELYPKLFRCAVAIDAPADLPTWVNPTARFVREQRVAYFGSDTAKLNAASPLSHADQVAGPVLLLASNNFGYGRTDELAAKLRQLGQDATYVRLSPSESAPVPDAKTALFRRINEFLNVNVYQYAVKIGLATKVDD